MINPKAIALWIVGASVGYAVHGGTGAAIGLAITALITIIV